MEGVICHVPEIPLNSAVVQMVLQLTTLRVSLPFRLHLRMEAEAEEEEEILIHPHPHLLQRAYRRLGNLLDATCK